MNFENNVLQLVLPYINIKGCVQNMYQNIDKTLYNFTLWYINRCQHH